MNVEEYEQNKRCSNCLWRLTMATKAAGRGSRLRTDSITTEVAFRDYGSSDSATQGPTSKELRTKSECLEAGPRSRGEDCMKDCMKDQSSYKNRSMSHFFIKLPTVLLPMVVELPLASSETPSLCPSERVLHALGEHSYCG
jgi:hypothetical protein